jgi:hypothetical protein
MGFFQWLKRLFTGGRKLASGVSPFPKGTGPSRLILLRHAEKLGDKRDPHLSLPGRQRAGRLVTYIPATFGQPQFLIAARTSKRSRRPVETLEPLAAALALEIRAKFDDNEISALIETLGEKPRYRGNLGVICWRHSELPSLMEALGVPSDASPSLWAETDYTTIIDVNFPGNGETKAKRLQMPF